LTAVIASRKEIPSGPGLAIRAVGVDVSPLTTSFVFETTRVVALEIEETRQKSVDAARRDTDRVDRLTPITSIRNCLQGL